MDDEAAFITRVTAGEVTRVRLAAARDSELSAP
jgi:hypothetical protein